MLRNHLKKELSFCFGLLVVLMVCVVGLRVHLRTTAPVPLSASEQVVDYSTTEASLIDYLSLRRTASLPDVSVLQSALRLPVLSDSHRILPQGISVENEHIQMGDRVFFAFAPETTDSPVTLIYLLQQIRI